VYLFISFVVFPIDYYYSYFDYIVYAFLTLIPVILTVAFFTLAERKIMASVQRRTGPTVVGF